MGKDAMQGTLRAAALTVLVALVAPVAGCAVVAPSTTGATRPPSSDPADAEGSGLVWAAEFDGEAGAALDPAEWMLSDRGDGYGNNEMQVYTPRSDNVWIDGDGVLHLIARAESAADPRGFSGAYTSGRIETRARFEHGRVEARIRVPAGQGLWSAFWLFGASLDGEQWPAVGEIDIMEVLGDAAEVHNGVIAARDSGERWTRSAATPGGDAYSEDWHVYAVSWDDDAIAFSVDDRETLTVSRDQLAADERWPFDRPYSITLNLAVGGDWPGPPDAQTTFPAEMLVDWVRVYDARVVEP